MSSMYGATAAATAIRALGGGSSSSPAGLLLASLISVSALFLVVQLLVPR